MLENIRIVRKCVYFTNITDWALPICFPVKENMQGLLSHPVYQDVNPVVYGEFPVGKPFSS